MICPECGSIFYFIKSSNNSSSVCEKCGFVGNLVKPSYKNYQENKYSNKVSRNTETDPLFCRLVNEMDFKKNDIVLDYGCGSGEYTSGINRFVKKVIGMDINTKIARKKNKNIFFLDVKNKNLPFKENYFNKIVCVNVIEHVLDYKFLLKEFRRVLKNNGKIYLTTFNKKFILHKLDYDETHLKEWDCSSFVKLVSKYFMVEVDYKYGIFFNYYPLNFLLVKLLKPEICVLAKKI